MAECSERDWALVTEMVQQALSDHHASVTRDTDVASLAEIDVYDAVNTKPTLDVAPGRAKRGARG